jgi:hypothetical protein
MGHAGEFLDTLFGDVVSEQARLVLWTLQNKAAKFFTSTAPAIVFLEAQAPRMDLYFGVSLMDANVIGSGRGKRDNVVCCPCYWADYDVFEEIIHPDQELPKTRDEVLDLLRWLIVKPTFTVDSAHGIQCVWAIEDPPLITTPEERAKVMDRRRWWAEAQAAWARQQGGWKYDVSTSDVTRVLRPPGTVNHKNGQHVEVRLLEPFSTGVPVPEDALLDLAVPVLGTATGRPVKAIEAAPGDDLPADGLGGQAARPVAVPVDHPAPPSWQDMEPEVIARGGVFEVRQAVPSGLFDQVTALCENSRDFKVAWGMSHPRFGEDCSRYLLSIANFGVRSARGDDANQFAVDLMTVFQSRWTKAKEPGRPADKHKRAWYIRTLHVVWANDGRGDPTEMAAAVDTAEIIEGGDDRIRDEARRRLGMPDFVCLEQHGAHNPEYFLRTETDLYTLGPPEVVTSYARFRNRLMSTSQGAVLLSTRFRRGWEDQVVPLLLRTLRFFDSDNEPRPTVIEILSDYFQATHAEGREQHWQDLLAMKAPFSRDGMIWVHVKAVRRALAAEGTHRTTADLRRDFKTAGMVRQTFRCTDLGTTYSYWGIPVDDLGLTPRTV